MSQFVIVPPLEKVAGIFTAATGQRLIEGVQWSQWVPMQTESMTWLRGYIRPCHQGVLNETIAGKTPLTLLRQILRPHDYYIDAETGHWSLRHGKPTKQVAVREGKVIVWDS
jgi:hypothetical protein